MSTSEGSDTSLTARPKSLSEFDKLPQSLSRHSSCLDERLSDSNPITSGGTFDAYLVGAPSYGYSKAAMQPLDVISEAGGCGFRIVLPASVGLNNRTIIVVVRQR